MIKVLPFSAEAFGREINVTSRSKGTKSRKFSPMLLGPVDLYYGLTAQNVENGWQFSKVYAQHLDGDELKVEYWEWAKKGWADTWAHRYPMGKGVKPEFSLWCGEQLDYIDARKEIYVPLYYQAVNKYLSEELDELAEIARSEDITIRDFDAYDHQALGYTLDDVVNDPRRRMGHGFVLAMMIEEKIKDE